jgi:2-methylcitrate dehydratase PrpD
MTASGKSVTEQLADWVVAARYEDIPQIGVERMKERFLDSLGVQLAGMSVRTGQIIADWVRSQGGTPESTVLVGGFKSTPSLATLANATAGHCLELDDSGLVGIHPSNPLTAAALAVAEQRQASGKDLILAWMVGWEVTAATSRPCDHPDGNLLLQSGWHAQGFAPALGVAALCAKLRGFDAMQTRMCLGNAASGMGGLVKNKGRDTKPLLAGNAAMHGVVAAEQTAWGLTANEDILDGEKGVARLLGRNEGALEKVLDGFGSWDMATNGSMFKVYANCGGGHKSYDAMLEILRKRPTLPDEIDHIDVYLHEFLSTMLPYASPQSGQEGKFSLEYGLAAIILDGRAGFRQFTDDLVRRPAIQALMERISRFPREGTIGGSDNSSRVVMRLKNGQTVEHTVYAHRGTMQNTLSREDLNEKFLDCAGTVVAAGRCGEVADLCWGLETVANMRKFVETIESGGDFGVPRSHEEIDI